MKTQITKLALTFLVGAFLFSCQPTPENPMAKTQDKRPIIYQVMTRLFGNQQSKNVPWGTIEENGVGKFNDFDSVALQAIKSLGITHVWYTGAIEHAVLTDYTQYGIALDDADVVKGRAGSPYAIKDYYDVNPDLAVDVNNRMDEFESLIARTHQAGMKVLIDFVPNHVARGYQSDAKPANTTDFGEDDDATQAFSINNNFYYLPDRPFVVPQDYNPLGEHTHPTKDGKFDESPAKATGNDVFSATPSVHDWFETIKLNYGVDYQNGRSVHFEETPDTWLKVKDILLFWAAKGVDGFRCDMAEMVPVEFWNWITAEIKRKHPEVVFIAEIYNPDAYRNYIFKGGFDYLYDKVELYDTLKHIIQQKATTDDITAIWQRQEGISDKMLRFLENHDEQRIASPDFAADMRKGIPMMAATAFMHTGPVMLYFGQDVGEPGMGESGFSGDDGRTTIFDYWGVPEHQKWMNDGLFDGAKLSSEQRQLQSAYQTILAAINTSEAIRAGGFFDLHYFNRNESYQGYSDMVYTFLRHTEDEAVLVAINFSEAYETAQIKIPVEAWEKINIHKGRILMTWTGGKAGVNRRTTEDYDQPSELVLKLEPLSYQLIRLQEKIK